MTTSAQRGLRAAAVIQSDTKKEPAEKVAVSLNTQTSRSEKKRRQKEDFRSVFAKYRGALLPPGNGEQ